MVTEYFEGGALDRRLGARRRVADGALTRRVAAQLAWAIEHLHLAGIIHRDIKAANVLLSKDGTASLADFGLASYCDEEQRCARDGRHPPAAQFAGTVEYMAPELFLSATLTYTAAVDWWSLGVLLYEIIAGVTPRDAAALVGDACAKKYTQK